MDSFSFSVFQFLLVLETELSRLFGQYHAHWSPGSLIRQGISNNCRQTSNTNHTLIGNKSVYHSDVVGASPVGAAPTTSPFLT